MIEHVEELRLAQQPSFPEHADSLDHNGNPADTMGQPGGGMPLLEAVLGHGLRHANVVETYKYATRRAEVRPYCRRQQSQIMDSGLQQHSVTPASHSLQIAMFVAH